MQPLTAKKYYHQDGNNRTAIYTSKIIKAWYLENLSSRDAVVIVTRINNRATMIASIYMDYNEKSPIIKPWFESIIERADMKGYAVLLGIDSSSHSTLYGKETNKGGEEIEDFIAQNRLTVENVGTTPAFNTMWGTSIIDITLTKRLASQSKTGLSKQNITDRITIP